MQNSFVPVREMLDITADTAFGLLSYCGYSAPGDITPFPSSDWLVQMYSNFLEEIDAIDNGIEVADGVLRYRITSTLSHRVGWLNPAWNEEGVSENVRFCEERGG